ncbi:rhomboid family intramembrane serine protease [Clostridium sp. KNHs205]|uniref:rhomboid family intramembrane serine protease n=1 Tax=Clostridium sp. KNHs205 TaxID=1449050 RepID=UPI00051AB1F4|nr:rhomboid family intramembrane serine protease [Clostridium sp. KNHs205]
MNLLNKLERKYGRYAIHNLMLYISILYGTGFVINQINPYFYMQYLMLDIEKILHGEVWRIVTFLIQPQFNNLLYAVIGIYFYYWIGSTLERAWGAFRFNLYYLSGMLLNVLAVVVIFLVTGNSEFLGMQYINYAMFLAFAVLFPDVQILLFFIIPIKIKYIAYLDAVFIAISLIQYFSAGNYFMCLAILLALGNFIFFFMTSRNYRRFSPGEVKRKRNFKSQVRSGQQGNNVVDFNGRKKITRHKCAVCGRTELDDENLEFRFCSKCDGNYEYCMDHLFTHEHVKKPDGDSN